SFHAQQQLNERLSKVDDPRSWTAAFVESPAYARFLSEGVVPEMAGAASLEGLREPQRSYLAALALLGMHIRLDVAMAFLSQLGFKSPPSELLVEGLTSLEGDMIVFSSEAARESA